MAANKTSDLETLTDLCTPWCVYVVATLRIAEHIAGGAHEVSQLAQLASCDTYALHRVLTHLVGKGLFEENKPGWYILNDLARELLDPVSHLGLDLGGIGGRMAYAWGTLLPYVRTGAPAYEQVFGLPFWEDLEAHPEVAASFNALTGPAGHVAFGSMNNGGFVLSGVRVMLIRLRLWITIRSLPCQKKNCPPFILVKYCWKNF